jgi:hypothetical protein
MLLLLNGLFMYNGAVPFIDVNIVDTGGFNHFLKVILNLKGVADVKHFF